VVYGKVVFHFGKLGKTANSYTCRRSAPDCAMVFTEEMTGYRVKSLRSKFQVSDFQVENRLPYRCPLGVNGDTRIKGVIGLLLAN
jgi:hypothetical protein